MILSAEALDILNFLKTAPGKYVSILEISRRAGGRRRFEETPGWAKHLISPLMAEGLLEVNARGHYRVKTSSPPETEGKAAPAPAPRTSHKPKSKIVGDDYFPSPALPKIVAGDYFPSAS